MPDDDDDFYTYYSDDPDSYDPPSDDDETPEKTTEQNESTSMLKFERLQPDCKFSDGTPLFYLDRAKIPGGWLVTMTRANAGCSLSAYNCFFGWGWGYGGATFIPDPEHKWDGSSID